MRRLGAGPRAPTHGPPARPRLFPVLPPPSAGPLAWCPQETGQVSNQNLGAVQGGHSGFHRHPKEKHIFLGNCNYLNTMSKQKSYFFSLETFIFPFYLSVCLLICLPFYPSVFFYSGRHICSSPVRQHFLSRLVQNSPQRSGIDRGAAGGGAVSAPRSAAHGQSCPARTVPPRLCPAPPNLCTARPRLSETASGKPRPGGSVGGALP